MLEIFKDKRVLRRKLTTIFAPRIFWCIQWAIYLTCRNRFYIHPSTQDSNAILAFWHGEIAMMPFLYRKIRKYNDKRKIFIVTSQHADGELVARLHRNFGMKSIRGSSKKGGLQVLIKAISEIKNGYDVAITPDGPKGPYHSIADGVVAIAQKTNVNVIIVHTEPSSYWQMNSWDRFKIPKPFSIINYYAHPTFKIDSRLSMDEAKEFFAQKINAESKEIFK